MKQLMQKLKKHDVIIVIILMTLICCGDVFFNSIITGDEYLLLNHTLKMYNRKNDL